MTLIAARCRLLLTGVATVAATALLAAPAIAAPSPAVGGAACSQTPVVQPFASWGDNADYFLAPDGGFEGAAADWALRGHAAPIAANEPFAVNAAGDAKALRLAAGSSATSPRFCIGVEHRTMRFFSDAAASSTLDVDAIVGGPGGSERSVRIATLHGADRWAPSDVVPMVVNELAAAHDNAIDVSLRFTPHGAGAWTIDDVLVDPLRIR